MSDHSYIEDERNANIKIGIRDGVTMNFKLFRRSEAKISVYGSFVLVGDGIWECLRAVNGNVKYAKEHLKILYGSAKALLIDIGVSKAELFNYIYQTIDLNKERTSPQMCRLNLEKYREETIKNL